MTGDAYETMRYLFGQAHGPAEKRADEQLELLQPWRDSAIQDVHVETLPATRTYEGISYEDFNMLHLRELRGGAAVINDDDVYEGQRVFLYPDQIPRVIAWLQHVHETNQRKQQH